MCAPPRNSRYHQDLLRPEEQACPGGTVCALTGNPSGRNSKTIRAWPEGHPRIRHAFLPEKPCRLSPQEAWRRIFRRQPLAGQDFAGPGETARAAQVATARLNARARPRAWGRPGPRHRSHRRRFVYTL